MKKAIVRGAACLLALVFLLSFAACGAKPTAEDYIKTDEVQSEIKALQDQVSGQGMSLDVTAEGNAMVFTFNVDAVEGVEADDLSGTMSAAMDAMSSQMESSANELKKVVDSDDASVKVIVNYDGQEIYSKEYTPTE